MGHINYKDIPNNLFLKAIKVRDIRKARVLTRKEKQKMPSGIPDIVIESPLGFEDTITRNELTKRYKYLDQSNIGLAGWKDSKKYLVVCEDNTPVYVMHIPSNYKTEIVVNGKVIKVNSTNKIRGDYIICAAKEDGSIDRSITFAVTNTMFRKMFKIIEKLQTTHRQTESNQKYVNTSIQDKHKTTSNEYNKPVTPRQDQRENRVMFTATHRILMNGKLVGFIIRENLVGKFMQINKAQLMEMCRHKKITNIGIKELNGKEYIHGIGLKIEELPIYEQN